MDWYNRIQIEKEKIEGIYGEWSNRPIKIYDSTYKGIILTEEGIEKFIAKIYLKTDIFYRMLAIVPIFGYGIPKAENLFKLNDKLIELNIKKILSIGAGNAFPEMLLTHLNPSLDISATDIVPPINNRYLSIINLDDQQILKNMNIEPFKSIKALMFVWPDPQKWVANIIQKCREKIINKEIELEYIIFIGEVFDGGSCMTDELCKELDNCLEIYDDYYDTFREINESIWIYKF
jgi:hypothetical protein